MNGRRIKRVDKAIEYLQENLLKESEQKRFNLMLVRLRNGNRETRRSIEHDLIAWAREVKAKNEL